MGNEFDRIVSKIKSNAYGDWVVGKDGSLSNEKAAYYIPAKRIREDWIKQMYRKQWVNMGDFLGAYFEALRIAGISDITIKV